MTGTVLLLANEIFVHYSSAGFGCCDMQCDNCSRAARLLPASETGVVGEPLPPPPPRRKSNSAIITVWHDVD